MMDDPQPNRRPASQMVQAVIEVQSPYKGWRYYFPEEGKINDIFLFDFIIKIMTWMKFYRLHIAFLKDEECGRLRDFKYLSSIVHTKF